MKDQNDNIVVDEKNRKRKFYASDLQKINKNTSKKLTNKDLVKLNKLHNYNNDEMDNMDQQDDNITVLPIKKNARTVSNNETTGVFDNLRRSSRERRKPAYLQEYSD